MDSLLHKITNTVWRARDGDSVLRLRYPLSKRSVVWDVGGYTGDWSWRINEKCQPRITIFEPMKASVAVLRARFKGKSNITIKAYGLSNRNHIAHMSPAGLDSSEYSGGNETAPMRDIAKELKNVQQVDLIKINIEGGEYDLLERLLKTGQVRKCKHLQVQFHTFAPQAQERRNAIVKALRKTHRRTYNYPFVWESWSRK